MAGAPPPNFANRTMWTRDNLDVLRGLNSESIDLVYADPPFNSNKNYEAPIGSKAAGAAFKDTWTLSDVDVAWHGEIAEREPRVYAAIDNAGIVHGKAMKSYLIMMAVRLLELLRVLKPTGSLYLHCDDTADAYLRMLCDAVFGRTSFRNAVIWKRSARSDGRRFGRTHDTLPRRRGRRPTSMPAPVSASPPSCRNPTSRLAGTVGPWPIFGGSGTNSAHCGSATPRGAAETS